MLKHFLSPPNWFTSASIFCGFYAILLAASNPNDPAVFYQAGLLIGFAGVFDMLDGRVARMTRTESEFGVQLDSLADVVSFGVAAKGAGFAQAKLEATLPHAAASVEEA